MTSSPVFTSRSFFAQLLLADSLRSDLRAAAIADMQQKQALVEQASSIKSLGDGLNDLLEDFADFVSAGRSSDGGPTLMRGASGINHDGSQRS